MSAPALPDSIAAIARTILYEGYILWPYRRSALKNQKRWTFGGVFPRAYSQIHPDDACLMRTECLLTGADDASVTVRARFLHVIDRMVARLEGDELVFVDELEVVGARHTSWQEAAEREIVCPPFTLAGAPLQTHVPIVCEGGESREWLGDGQHRAAAVVRRWHAIHGAIDINVTRLQPGLHRVAVTIANNSHYHGEERAGVLMRTMTSTHTVLQARGGEFVSLIDPPIQYRAAAAECRNTGTWPVLAGEPTARDAMLSSPIILYDYPQIAPESPGDFFDASEIDQLMVLSILGMSVDEQKAMEGTDPAARTILERCRALTPEQLMRLHGTARSFRRTFEH